jgi:integrase
VAQKIRGAKLETRTARLRLPVARKPVFVKIGQQVGLGYRRNATAGTWVVRVADGKGGNWTKRIALADDVEESNGSSVLTYWQAQEKALAIAGKERDGEHNGAARPATVAEALERYETDLKARGADIGNVARVRVHLGTGMLARSVALLSMAELKAWRDGLLKKLAPATVNRTCVALKAALNLAAESDSRILARRAWESGLATIPDATESRNIILQEPVIRGVIAAAYALGTEFGLLVEVAAVTGARISQLARLMVRDLQDDKENPRLTMPTSRKGRGNKKLTHRPVPIPPALAHRLRVAAAERPPTAPLLVKRSGAPWLKSDHSRLLARAVAAVGQDPKIVTIYALRHSNIVRQLLANVPIRVVAVNHDTSVAMLERTYSRHIGDHADALARAALLQT